MTATRAPAWVRDEVILACDLVRQNGWRWLLQTDPRVAELSSLLQHMPLHPAGVRGPKFRNINGVSRKTADIATNHPDYRGKRTHGGALDREVLQNFLDQPKEMAAAADAIRSGIRSGSFDATAVGWDDDEEVAEAVEGRLLARRHFARERNPRLREKKIRAHLSQHGSLACEACGFDFEATYGPHGARYIECHHILPLHASGQTTTRLDDLMLICANCHRMVHRGKPWLTPEELKRMIRTH
ncbi:5-methylcytosine-specific restriction enzyme A [Amycolatopsis arida]|uniref:5-methylcytosine-specific restriction enzyme A n=1 Tax=Amycolatopsis arida TaxID=587909 RepID=A0A1I5TXN5_9PSEU|nr:HNH endonuclease [Amycolatopsis arida]TDX95918.1 5-methylcytosine-specific restriction protein A [Amycolatopsis arida]SFP87825.1 5-methylcytosine-specific restriction enzyme A [Amycolatopsis arida]